jgi:ADP-heptose:LPS heptosyltransferase
MLASISYRLAPATKIAQLFYHRRLTQRRSRSEKPEYAYNQDLVIKYLQDTGVDTIQQPAPPYLTFDQDEINQLREKFCQAHNIPQTQLLVFIHAGSGGSANNLSLEQYAEIGRRLESSTGHHIVISAGPGELEQARALGERLADTPHTLYHSTAGLEAFARHIAFADLFISGSTGPLHIAGALNRNTAAFYPLRRSATALRWQTTNEEQKRAAFSPPPSADQDDMSGIDPVAVTRAISEKFLLV